MAQRISNILSPLLFFVPTKKVPFMNYVLWKLVTNLFLINDGKLVKDTHRENTAWNKTEALTESVNMCIGVDATLNQWFIRVLALKLNFPKNEAVSGKSTLFLICPFGTLHLSYLKIGFWQGSFVWKCCIFNLTTLN